MSSSFSSRAFSSPQPPLHQAPAKLVNLPKVEWVLQVNVSSVCELLGLAASASPVASTATTTKYTAPTHTVMQHNLQSVSDQSERCLNALKKLTQAKPCILTQASFAEILRASTNYKQYQIMDLYDLVAMESSEGMEVESLFLIMALLLAYSTVQSEGYFNIYGGQIFDILYEKEVAEDMLLSPTDDESEKISTEALRAFVCLFGATDAHLQRIFEQYSKSALDSVTKQEFLDMTTELFAAHDAWRRGTTEIQIPTPPAERQNHFFSWLYCCGAGAHEGMGDEEDSSTRCIIA